MNYQLTTPTDGWATPAGIVKVYRLQDETRLMNCRTNPPLKGPVRIFTAHAFLLALRSDEVALYEKDGTPALSDSATPEAIIAQLRNVGAVLRLTGASAQSNLCLSLNFDGAPRYFFVRLSETDIRF